MKNKRNTQYTILIALILICLILPQIVQAATTNQISQFGITWTFDRDYEYGQFVNGDYWVVGPVTIISIDPCSFTGNGIETQPGTGGGWIVASGRTVNGSMINPVPNAGVHTSDTQGYDSAAAGYQSNLNVAGRMPLVLPAGTSLVSAISLDHSDPQYINGKSRLLTAAVLTVLNSEPEPNSFRPPYCGTDKTIKYNENDLNYSILASLSGTGIRKAISGAATHLIALHKDILTDPNNQSETVERLFERVWLMHFDPGGFMLLPTRNMFNYGKNRAVQEAIGGMMLQLDFTNAQKRILYIRMVQLGIDYYGIVTNGTGYHVFTNGAGTCVGGKFPIILAGLALNDANMKAIGEKSGAYGLSGTRTPTIITPPADYIYFCEDFQTFYVTEDDVYSQPYDIYTTGSSNVYTTGTIDVNYGETKVTGHGTSWLSLPAETYFFVVVGDNEANSPTAKAFTVASIDSNTQLTLVEPYQHTSVSNGAYKLADVICYGHGVPGKIDEKNDNWYDYEEFTSADLGVPNWGGDHIPFPIHDGGRTWPANYQGISSDTMCGYVLATLIMGGKTSWNHNALFDYTDRWMQVTIGQSYRAESDFIEDMWDKHRADYGCVYNGVNTTTHQRIYDCAGEVVDCSSVTTCLDYPNQIARDCDPCNLGCAAPILYGDVSGNGEISAYDAALTAQYAVGLIELTPEQIKAADVSGNGEVSAYDAALIAQRAVGLIDKFPVEP